MDERNQSKTSGNEPQSYGSQEEWLRGRTGQTVNETPNTARRHDEAFYDDQRDGEQSEAPQGGLTSPIQRREAAAQPGRRDDASVEVTGTPIQKISEMSDERRSYWKDRDYS